MSGQERSLREEVWPGREWASLPPAEVGLDPARLAEAAAYAGGAGIVVRRGHVACAWGDTRAVHHIQSATKSIGVTALGLAIADGKVRLEDAAARHHPWLGVPPEGNRATGWLEHITIRHLASMTAGFAKDGGYTGLLFPPGAMWAYSDGGANWLGECVTLAYRTDLAGLLRERVFRPLDIPPEELIWRDNAYRPDRLEGITRREIGAGVFASAGALAKIGLLYLARGRWGREQILPEAFVDGVSLTPPTQARLPVTEDALERFAGASAHYGLLWWSNADGSLPGVPRDAYWAWGLGDSLMLVLPSLGLAVARVGQPFPGERRPSYYRVLAPFFVPLAAAAGFQPGPEHPVRPA
jgi:CubicO group peptidase (beta-lactamase class C family)